MQTESWRRKGGEGDTQLAGCCACRYNVANLASPPSSSSFSPRFGQEGRREMNFEFEGLRSLGSLAGALC